jgi:hypothetical protein
MGLRRRWGRGNKKGRVRGSLPAKVAVGQVVQDTWFWLFFGALSLSHRSTNPSFGGTALDG